MKGVLWFAAFVLLTVLTQVGGVALLVAWFGVRVAAGGMSGWRRVVIGIAVFVAVYAALTAFVVPRLALLAGRVQLPCFASEGRPFAAANPVFCALNRNYVEPRLAALTDALARSMATEFPGTVTLYLDASFPFVDGFPMLPHLSHDDGRKVDLAFWYREGGAYAPGQIRSPVGYGAFESPPPGAVDRCDPNALLTLRWDLGPLQRYFRALALDEERTRAALGWLFDEGRSYGVERVFVEPHLAERLDVSSPLLGFQGCRAARHDDHIHVQIERHG